MNALSQDFRYALAAAYPPARRASRTNAIDALRNE